MHIHTAPDTLTKLAKMADATSFEPAGDSPQSERKRAPRDRYQSRSLAECISNVSTPQGKKPILKSMLTTACERNCNYCPFRAGRAKTERITITPDQMAKAFDDLARAKQVEGMFLSSGIIKGSVTTQDKLIDTVEIVRRKYRYRGYIHLKIMPGAEYDQLYRAMQLADRVSINLEAPTSERMADLAPKKAFERELLDLLVMAEKIRRDHPQQKLARSVTQFVVGAVGDTDLELLTLSGRLYRQTGLTRAYYSAFEPVIQTPLENVAATNPRREFRLYQSSFLLRDYQWEVEDLPFLQDGNLDLNLDPKRAWADANLIHAPIEVMTADKSQLMRIPGIGPKSADAIIRGRAAGKIIELVQLRKLGIAAPEQAAPYILVNGRRPPQQLSLF